MSGVAVWDDGADSYYAIFVSNTRNTSVPTSAIDGSVAGNQQTWVNGITNQNYHHPEIQMAYHMRQNNITEASIYINQNYICGGCIANLEKVLPPNSRLTVHYVDGRGVAQSPTFTGK